MTETHREGPLTAAVSDALVALHKEQFGRGPMQSRTNFAGPDVMVTVLQDALLPAEKALVEMGQALRVMEARAFYEEATRDKFIEVIEQIVRRKVYSFHSTCDPRTGIVMEIAIFEPRESGSDQSGPVATEDADERVQER
jgi:uncharacterized protein YbcI